MYTGQSSGESKLAFSSHGGLEGCLRLATAERSRRLETIDSQTIGSDYSKRVHFSLGGRPPAVLPSAPLPRLQLDNQSSSMGELSFGAHGGLAGCLTRAVTLREERQMRRLHGSGDWMDPLPRRHASSDYCGVRHLSSDHSDHKVTFPQSTQHGIRELNDVLLEAHPFSDEGSARGLSEDEETHAIPLEDYWSCLYTADAKHPPPDDSQQHDDEENYAPQDTYDYETYDDYCSANEHYTQNDQQIKYSISDTSRRFSEHLDGKLPRSMKTYPGIAPSIVLSDREPVGRDTASPATGTGSTGQQRSAVKDVPSDESERPRPQETLEVPSASRMRRLLSRLRRPRRTVDGTKLDAQSYI